MWRGFLNTSGLLSAWKSAKIVLWTAILLTGSDSSLLPEDALFTPGTIPIDTNGAEVHAHGGGMVQLDDTFFWYGTTIKYPPAWISKGINLYSSKDLQTWNFEGQIFYDEQIVDVPGSHPYRIERPKILFSKKMNEYTLLFHLDSPDFALKSVGVAKAASIRGPWTFVKAFKPDGMDSYDMTAWQDDDGTAYLARSVQNQFLGISQLTDDFSNTTGICASSSQAEAPAIFKPAAGHYFVIGSHLTGWAANPALLFALEGGSPCAGSLLPVAPPAEGSGSESTFDSQPAFVFPLELADGSVLQIYMGDRWNFYGPGCVGAASYVWLPLVPRSEGGYELRFHRKWRPRDFGALDIAQLSDSYEGILGSGEEFLAQAEIT